MVILCWTSRSKAIVITYETPKSVTHRQLTMNTSHSCDMNHVILIVFFIVSQIIAHEMDRMSDDGSLFMTQPSVII